MNQEKLNDYLDYFKNNHQKNQAIFGAIIAEKKTFTPILDALKNDYILIEINNSDFKKQLENFLRMRDTYKNFVIFITEKINEKNKDAITQTIKNQKIFPNIKLLILSDSNNFNSLNIFNLINSTCRI